MSNTKVSKEKIFAAAKKIANEQGLKKVNIRNVAAECHVSIGSVYNYYETKGDLVFEVVRDYWQSAFDRTALAQLPTTDFCDFFAAFYPMLGKKLMGFMAEWVSVMSTFSESEKAVGKQHEAETFGKVKEILNSVLANDPNVNTDIWLNTFDKEEMLDFIIFNMISMLKQGQRDCSFFIKVLRELLY